MPERPTQSTAEGTFAKTPIAHLLAYLAERRLSGSLALATSDGERLVCFREGGVAKVHPAGPAPIDGLVRLPETTTYRFYEGVDLLPHEPDVANAPLDPLEVIWTAVAATPPGRVVDDVLGRLGARALKVHPEADIERFGLDPVERGVVERMRASALPLADLLAAKVADDPVVRRVVYLLVVTRHLDHGTGVHPIGFGWPRRTPAKAGGSQAPVAPPVPMPAPPALAPELVARRRAILERAESLERQDHFTTLGVGRDVSPSDAQAAYFALAKIWHTDRLSPLLADVRERATAVFARMTEAFEVLSDPERRTKYVASLGSGPAASSEEDERVQRILEAASEFQKAEILLRKHDLVNAEVMAARACEGDPEQADYLALHLTIVAQRRPPPAAIDDLLARIDAAIARDDHSERAYFCRANLLKRAGKTAAAIADFRRVVQLNPRNVDAARELRLFEMRKSRPSVPEIVETVRKPEDEKKDNRFLGALGKLFKR